MFLFTRQVANQLKFTTEIDFVLHGFRRPYGTNFFLFCDFDIDIDVSRKNRPVRPGGYSIFLGGLAGQNSGITTDEFAHAALE